MKRLERKNRCKARAQARKAARSDKAAARAVFGGLV